MTEIMHPFVPETAQLFKSQPESERNKVVFIHFNHTNSLIFDEEEALNVRSEGYQVAREGQIFDLN